MWNFLAQILDQIQNFCRDVTIWQEAASRRQNSKSHQIVIMFPRFRSMSLSCAMKIAVSDSYRAVPSMFTVAPIGMTKRVTLASKWFFSSRQKNVRGSVAVLKRCYVKYSVSIFPKNVLFYSHPVNAQTNVFKIRICSVSVINKGLQGIHVCSPFKICPISFAYFGERSHYF